MLDTVVWAYRIIHLSKCTLCEYTTASDYYMYTDSRIFEADYPLLFCSCHTVTCLILFIL